MEETPVGKEVMKAKHWKCIRDPLKFLFHRPACHQDMGSLLKIMSIFKKKNKVMDTKPWEICGKPLNNCSISTCFHFITTSFINPWVNIEGKKQLIQFVQRPAGGRGGVMWMSFTQSATLSFIFTLFWDSYSQRGERGPLRGVSAGGA